MDPRGILRCLRCDPHGHPGVLALWPLGMSWGFALRPVGGPSALGRESLLRSFLRWMDRWSQDMPQRRRAPMTHSLAS